MASAKPIYQLPQDAVWFSIGLALSQLIIGQPNQRLVATARDTSKLANLADGNSRVRTVSLDVTENDSISAAVETAVEAFGRIDVLVNNAGYGLMGDSESALQPESYAKARKVIETDLWGTITLSLHAVRIFRDVNPRTGQKGGVVLNVTSLGGFAGFPGQSFYHAAKFGVEGFTESLNKEVRPEWNIHFSCIEPGGTKSNFITGSMQWLAPHPAYQAADTPGRLMEGYVRSPKSQMTFTPAENIAAGMYRVVSLGSKIPVRVPLSEAAWMVVKTEAEEVVREMEAVKDLSLGVDENIANDSGAFFRKTFN
ncbi:hypothetical protein S40285_09354 [Stachybotrys chlorohalonatus IBT 40285]|uniref:Uncharacterized protein n=1 Tax=Stachybotrys chlorohalonatus (strain IBT 40285) TaxID=1283841 RepID=A0A084QDS3_STAC4|nr:hypothetical protein S40285_09354 [Stachybotrys chlorohalonata IBT 40285]